MSDEISGYHGAVLEVDLTSGTMEKKPVSTEDTVNYVGGRGLGMKMLWDRVREPGINPLSPENPLMLMTGAFTGFPIPAASRTCVVTKSPVTSPVRSPYPFASTVAYSNVGGFIGPEIRLAGYDGIVITGSASSPVYLVIDDDEVEIRDAGQFWGMGTDEFDRRLIDELEDREFETCYIGPAGENLVPYASIVHTAARAAGRGGAGCVMGSKKLKGIAIKGSQMPSVKEHRRYLELLEQARSAFPGPGESAWQRSTGTTFLIESYSSDGIETVRNFREGTFEGADQIGSRAARNKLWRRDFACYVCPLACKKSGVVREGTYNETLVHEGPEFEGGTMLGANLLISDLGGLMRCLFAADDLGMDAISAGNTIGFLMEAREKEHIDSEFLDGVDLTWGNVEAVLEMIRKIGYRDGVGDLASQGVKALSERIGRDSGKFAMHVKGQGLAAHNVYRQPAKGISYVSANRGACHINGQGGRSQNAMAMTDSLGICWFSTSGLGGDHTPKRLRELLSAITGIEWTQERYLQAGERIFNLEKMFNFREGFTREDDGLPDRFFEESPTTGPTQGVILDREKFDGMVTKYYADRGWDPETSRPTDPKLESLGLSFTIQS